MRAILRLCLIGGLSWGERASYGVMAYTVAQRRRKVGHLTWGAASAPVKRMFLRRG
jgi:hypothetical protein